jgi:hypothetical protein
VEDYNRSKAKSEVITMAVIGLVQAGKLDVTSMQLTCSSVVYSLLFIGAGTWHTQEYIVRRVCQGGLGGVVSSSS